MLRSPEFLLGANLPWIRYGGDFGANAWRPEGGIGADGVPPVAREKIRELRERGVTMLRWFLFCDGRAGIAFGPDGEPLGIDAFVLRDVESALETASDLGVAIMFVLFDFYLCGPAVSVNGVMTRGHRGALAIPQHRAALLDRVVSPVLQRFGQHSAIRAWDLFNEPEWAASRVPEEALREFIAEGAALVHEVADQPVTVGLASTRGLGLVRQAELDFYQLHWYDKLEHHWPLARPVSELGLDKPVLLGEFPTKGSRRSTAEVLAIARVAGYSGACLWSVLADDQATDYEAGLRSLRPIS